FLEAAEVYGDYYGTPRRQVEQALREGKDVLLEIDTEGARQVRAIYPDGVFIFIAPPSLQELRNRILKRGTEPEEVMERRLMLAKSELERMREYDYVVVNNEVHQAVATIKAIITAEKCRSRRVAFLLSSSL
ncbi:MAG: guanylate kinase, partial [Clostridia bacterium]|nr:guanylate kinase [Clostridia bacterium]